MEHSLQLIASVALILTAAVVAFICDMLQRTNGQLREMNLELQIRQEEARKRLQPVEAPAPQPLAYAALPPAPKERPVLKEKKRTVNPEALAVMERGAALASPTVKTAPAPVPGPAKKDWGSLLNKNAKPRPAAEPLPFGFQTGFHDGFVLSKLVQSRQPISGLVVSIGVNSTRKGDRQMPDAISKLVGSLIGPTDFAAKSGDDEFLLIYPQERGASAQRRLSLIAQQLWDFQLRSLASCQILFSWGGVEVNGESIEDAIASASERMQETKRGRRLLGVDGLRQAG